MSYVGCEIVSVIVRDSILVVGRGNVAKLAPMMSRANNEP